MKKPSNKSISQALTFTVRREQIARRYLEGRTQTEIAKEFEVNQSTVSRDLEAIRQIWLDKAVTTFDKVKAKELARIDRLEREYWDAWDRSKEDSETIKQTGKILKKDKKAVVEEATKTVRGQVGNPSFLNGVQWCIEQRLKIFGIYSAVKVDVDWRESVPEGVNADSVFEQDVEQLLQLMTEGQ